MKHRSGAAFFDTEAPGRARATAVVLGFFCLAWLPVRVGQDAFGAAQPIAGTWFTLVFIGSALFLLAARAVLGGSAPTLTRVGVWLAPLLFAMHARYHVDRIAGGFSFLVDPETFARGAEVVLRTVPVAAGVVLLFFAWRPWAELRRQPGPAAAD